MSEPLVILPILVALGAAIGTLLTRAWPRVQQAVSLLGVLGYAVAVAALAEAVLPATIVAYQVGNWPAPFGITLVADALSVFMLVLTTVVAVPALGYSIRSIDAYGQRLSYHTVFQFLLAGVSGAFLTGDIFNLFVWFEVLLLSSYVLVVFYSGPEQTRAALRYVVLNLVGSAVMLLSIGGLYATVGTLNMADLARRLATPGAYGIEPAPVLGLSALLFAVFALKAGLVPFQFWVPAAYRVAPAPVTAMLAGVVKKVGVYAIIRLYLTVFAASTLEVSLPGVSGGSLLDFYGPLLFVVGTASIIFGGIGALSGTTMDDVLSYSSISQVGFIILAIAVAATASEPGVQHLAVTAALVYALSHAVGKALLFLASGTLKDTSGTDSLPKLGGLAGSSPVLSATVFVGGLAMVGIPPLSGFFGKLLVFDAAASASQWGVLAVALLGAILTLGYITRLWNQGFWGQETPLAALASPDQAQLTVLVVMALAVLAIGVGFDPVYRFAEAAGEAALAREEYIDAVLGEDARSTASLLGGGLV